MTMYDRIRELRISLGMSQEDLAHKMGYKDRSMITKIEAGIVDISQKKIVAFANALSTTPRYLMDGAEKSATENSLSADERYLVDIYRTAEDYAQKIAVETLEAHQKKAIENTAG